MKIVVFSDNKELKKKFEPSAKSLSLDISFKSLEKYKSSKSLKPSDLNYFDISSFPEDEDRENFIKQLCKRNDHLLGIMDTKGMIKDPASLFHAGFVDYLGKNFKPGSLNKKRIKKILKFVKYEEVSSVQLPSAPGFEQDKLSGDDWKNIRSGKDYIFTLMFFELDGILELKDKLGKKVFNETIESMRNYLENELDDFDGRIWIWSETGGIILFPFDGETCEAIVACLRLMMNRRLICIEDIRSNYLLSYRIILHIGETTYKARGRTGNIVSDSVNSIFHLGQIYAQPGNCYITETVFPYVPEKIHDLFLPVDAFEGRSIKKLMQLN